MPILFLAGQRCRLAYQENDSNHLLCMLQCIVFPVTSPVAATMTTTTTATNLLKRRYQMAAKNWHNGMQKMGFIDSYEAFFKSASKAGFLNHNVKHIVDIGVGSAAMAVAFHLVTQSLTDVTGIDASQNMLRVAEDQLAKQNINFSSLKRDLADTTALRGLHNINVFVCAHVIEHFDQPEKLLAQIRHRLSAQGYLFIVVSKPHWCNQLIRWRWKHSFYTEEQVTQLAVLAGLTLKSTYEFTSGPASRMSRGYVLSR